LYITIRRKEGNILRIVCINMWFMFSEKSKEKLKLLKVDLVVVIGVDKKSFCDTILSTFSTLIIENCNLSKKFKIV
jgi:hypothetical protein